MKVKLSLSRNSNDVISLSIKDCASLVTFIECEMTPSDFAYLITGQAFMESNAKVKGLDLVGKTKVQEQRAVEYNFNTTDRAVFKLSLSRNSNDVITLSIKDCASLVTFIECEMTPADFAYLITGQALMEADAKMKGLDLVGKTKVQEQRSVEYNFNTTDRTVLSKWIEDNCQEEGWTIDQSLTSRDSVSWQGNKSVLNYKVYKYVDNQS